MPQLSQDQGRGIVEAIDWELDTNTINYPLDDKVRNINRWLSRVYFLIQKVDKHWRWNDSANASGAYEADTAYAVGTGTYDIATARLKILKVQGIDSNGTYRDLIPIDTETPGFSMSNYKTTNGTPREYAIQGDDIIVKPAPDFANAAGLRINFQPNFTFLTTLNTSTVPGFAEPFQDILVFGPSWDYARKNSFSTQRKTELKDEITKIELSIIDFYANRHARARKQITLRKEDYGQDALGRGGFRHPDRF